MAEYVDKVARRIRPLVSDLIKGGCATSVFQIASIKLDVHRLPMPFTFAIIEYSSRWKTEIPEGGIEVLRNSEEPPMSRDQTLEERIFERDK